MSKEYRDVEGILTDDAVVRPSSNIGNSDSSFPRGKFETRSQRSYILTDKLSERIKGAKQTGTYLTLFDHLSLNKSAQ